MIGKTLNTDTAVAADAERDTEMTEKITREEIEAFLKTADEMEAIVAAARGGKHGIVGGSLYTTTFPCHNCARHIVAAGISKVFYVEPYAKSLALHLHSDSISVTGDEGTKCAFLQYEGVGPDSVLKLFHHGVERKKDGKAITADKKSAHPVLPPPMDGFTTHEKKVIRYLQNVEGEVGERRTGA